MKQNPEEEKDLMSKYLYETHMHTCFGSRCGVSTGKEHVHYYLDQGFTGIIVTDHFFGGNCAVDRSLPWEQRIDDYWKGYEDALEEGLKVGLDVFFGIEQNYQGDEYLIYGLTKEYMKAHPEMEHWTRREQLEKVHAAGGAVIQAHPFRLRAYMDKIRLGELFADGAEVANAGNAQPEDARALRYARDLNLVMTAGSDNHHSPAPMLFGVELDRKLTSILDYVQIILNREPIGLHVPAERFILPDEPIDEQHRAWGLLEDESLIARDEY